MKAKTVNEAIGKLLRPKSPQEIKDALRNIKIASFNLKSFFKIIDVKEANILKYICEEKFSKDPYEFDVCRIPEYVESIINIAYKPQYQSYCSEIVLDKTDRRVSSIYYDSPYKKFFEYNTYFKIIRFDGNSGGWSYYHAFPRKEIVNILFAISENI